MREIIGNTTATPTPRSDWNQTDETKADYIKNKPEILTNQDVIDLITANTIDKVQSDWNQTDNEAADYIKNKPNYGEKIEELEAKIDNIENELPVVSADDNGKFLRVVEGSWAASEYEGTNGSFVLTDEQKAEIFNFVLANMTTEEWTFTIKDDGSTVTKRVFILPETTEV